MTGLFELASFWLAVLKWQARELWDSLPGPWYVKIVILIITQIIIPGPVDDLVLFAALAAFRWLRARRQVTA